MGTLHANNANQTLDRVVNFFPDERKAQVMMDLASNLKAVISQRLVRSLDGKRKAAIEILLNTPTVAELLSKGQSAAIKPIMDKSRQLGMQTFDQALFDLYEAGHINYEEAIRNADSTNELRLAIKLRSKRGEPSTASGMALAMEEEKPAEDETDEAAKPAA
jgi:twitching motility protein PilU